MTAKTISVPDDVYDLLLQLKLPHENLGDVIKRLCQEKTARAVAQWATEHPLWSDMSQEEYQSLQKSLNETKKQFHPYEVKLD